MEYHVGFSDFGQSMCGYGSTVVRCLGTCALGIEETADVEEECK